MLVSVSFILSNRYFGVVIRSKFIESVYDTRFSVVYLVKTVLKVPFITPDS